MKLVIDVLTSLILTCRRDNENLLETRKRTDSCRILAVACIVLERILPSSSDALHDSRSYRHQTVVVLRPHALASVATQT